MRITHRRQVGPVLAPFIEPQASPAGWIVFVGDGTAITDSYGVSSLTDTGTSNWTVNWTYAFSSTNYAFAGSGFANSATAINVGKIAMLVTDTPTATATKIMGSTGGNRNGVDMGTSAGGGYGSLVAYDQYNRGSRYMKRPMDLREGVCGFWISFDGSGTPAIKDSFNVTSITDNAAGDWTLNLTNPMLSAEYPVGMAGRDAGTASVHDDLTLHNTGGTTATTCRVACRNYFEAAQDPTWICVFGING